MYPTPQVHRKLQLMKQELRFPYRDRRRPFAGHTLAELFTALSGESLAALQQGLLVRCRVVKADGRFGLQVHNNINASRGLCSF